MHMTNASTGGSGRNQYTAVRSLNNKWEELEVPVDASLEIPVCKCYVSTLLNYSSTYHLYFWGANWGPSLPLVLLLIAHQPTAHSQGNQKYCTHTCFAVQILGPSPATIRLSVNSSMWATNLIDIRCIHHRLKKYLPFQHAFNSLTQRWDWGKVPDELFCATDKRLSLKRWTY